MPFKTKLVPNWKMDWGKKYENATYPVREKHPVELWDIREFVKEQKKKKMEEMINNPGESEMMPGMMDGGMSKAMFGANPFAMNTPNPNMSNSSAFNISCPVISLTITSFENGIVFITS